MAIGQGLCGFAVRQLIEGVCATVGLKEGGEAVVGFLVRHFSDHSQRLTAALQQANDRAWRTLEVALAGESLLGRLACAEDRAFRQQIRAFLDTPGNDVTTTDAGFRERCLRDLRSARKAGRLAVRQADADALVRQSAEFARFSDPQAVLDAEHSSMRAIARELGDDYPDLARLLELEPVPGRSLLIVGVRYFFRRAVEDDAQLAQGLTFARLEELSEAQERSLVTLETVLREQGQRLEGLLDGLQTLVAETHDAVFDLQAQMEGQGEQVRQIGQAVQKLLEQHHLERRELRPGDSLSIRNDNERQLVKQLVARYRALPETDRRQVPALLNAIGKLEVVAGEFEAAQKDFQAVALLEKDQKAQAEAHYNAYLACLERRDWPRAIQEFLNAARLGGKWLASFPVGKYQPIRILGAGGFGVAFLCKHKYMDAQVVVKALALESLGRDADSVFTEAQVLRELDHPAIIRISDCGYVEATSKSRPFLVMDYFAPGTTLEQHVQKHGPLGVDDLLLVARQVAEALHAAHGKGILHRDIKPANLLVRQDESGWKAKVIDFGLALRQKVIQKSMTASTGRRGETLVAASIAGTLDYAAPEQMGKRQEPVGRYSDVHAWGKTCCYALFETPHPTLRHWQSLPGPLAELLGRCLEGDPKRRPQGFGEVLAALDAIATGPGPQRPQTHRAPQRVDTFETDERMAGRRPEARRRKRGRTALALLIGSGMVLAMVAMAVVLGVMLRSKVKEGTLLVEVDQPGAEVYVDDQLRHTIGPIGDEQVEVGVPEGRRLLKVAKSGFKTFTKEFIVKGGGKETIRVRLDPVAVAHHDPLPAPPDHVELADKARPAPPPVPPPQQPGSPQSAPPPQQNEDWRRGIELRLDEFGVGRLTVGNLSLMPGMDPAPDNPTIKNWDGAEVTRLKDGRYRMTYDFSRAQTDNSFERLLDKERPGRTLDRTVGLLILKDARSGAGLSVGIYSPEGRDSARPWKLPFTIRLSVVDVLDGDKYFPIFVIFPGHQLKAQLFPDAQSGWFREQGIHWVDCTSFPEEQWSQLLAKQMIRPGIGTGFRVPPDQWQATGGTVKFVHILARGGMLSIRRIEVVGANE